MKTNILFAPDSHISDNVKPYYQLLSQVNQQEKLLVSQSDATLKKRSRELQLKCQSGDISDELVVEAYALIKQVIQRQLKVTPYDVQIIGALALHRNNVVEMQTGEGKTLTAVFPAYLNALTKKGVHVLTFNDYLAKRDADWMRPVYEFLGLTVGYIQEGMAKTQKRTAYHCDITYATAKEIGFDYLRSFIAYHPEELILRPFYYTIVDEADALLIDEARNPLVLAGDMINSGINFYKVAHFVAALEKGTDFGLDDYSRNIFLTELGIEKVEQEFSINNLHSNSNLNLHSAINLAIHARVLLIKDVDYVVKDDEIKLVDEFTGRIVEDRKWRNGLQTAVEAKEGVTIHSEGNILNSISLQHFICQYPKKSGMTGTAANAAEEFHSFYGLEVVVIPPNKPCQRFDSADKLFMTKAEKTNAIIDEVKSVHKAGRPVLIGTLTVKESEELVLQFKEHGILCQVLNARNNEQEAEIIADAGRVGAVTISTNMAGRGTDILLGGKDGREKDRVTELGGLYVIGTNRHESIRIDMQLRGRAGRQGDVGSSRFFISLEDDLMIKYRLKEALPKKLRSLNGNLEENKFKMVKQISHIQRVIEGQVYDIRKTLFYYSDFIEKQRIIIQTERQQLLLNEADLMNYLAINYSEIDMLAKNHDLVNKLRESTLFQYDLYWTDHLDCMQQIREGIHLLKLGGQNPVREFHKKANKSFLEMCDNIDLEAKRNALVLLKTPNKTLTELGIKKPSSTWTYMINDNPFGRQLSIMLLSNVGLQVDLFSTIILGVFGIFEKIKSVKQTRNKQTSH